MTAIPYIAIIIIALGSYAFIELDHRIGLPRLVRNVGYSLLLLNIVGGAICFAIAMTRLP